MEKLKINLSALKVESFETGIKTTQKGTVKANVPEEKTKTNPGFDSVSPADCIESYPITCDGTCNEFTCAPSCGRTCTEPCISYQCPTDHIGC